jgi:hypothetical protein
MRPVMALFMAATACVVFMPDRIPGEPGLHERFAVFFFSAMILLSSVVPWSRFSRRHALAICALAVLYQAARVEYFASFARDSRDFTPAILPADPQATLLGLSFTGEYRGHPVYTHFADYFIVWSRGIAVTEAAQFRFGTVRSNPAAPALPRHDSSPGASVDFDALAARVDYVLLRGESPRMAALDARFALERASGAWRLYRSRQRLGYSCERRPDSNSCVASQLSLTGGRSIGRLRPRHHHTPKTSAVTPTFQPWRRSHDCDCSSPVDAAGGIELAGGLVMMSPFSRGSARQSRSREPDAPPPGVPG